MVGNGLYSASPALPAIGIRSSSCLTSPIISIFVMGRLLPGRGDPCYGNHFLQLTQSFLSNLFVNDMYEVRSETRLRSLSR